MKRKLVRDWMTEDVMIVGPYTNLTELHALMLQEKVRHIPVVQGNQMIGIISRGDMRSAFSLSLSDDEGGMLRVIAEEVMTPDPITVYDDVTVDEAAKIMLKRKISGLPVINRDDNIVGIITESDILRMVVEEWVLH